MAIVVKWRSDGEYLSKFCHDVYGDPELGWSGRQNDAVRFTSKKDALKKMHYHTGVSVSNLEAGARFVRLVARKRHVSPER